MSLAPLLAAPAVVQIHVAAALAALLLGAAQFALPKGDGRHRVAGWAWVALMGTVSLSAFGLTGHAGGGNLSWVHGIAAGVLLLLPLGVVAARRGRIAAHRTRMAALFLGGLVITGAFTLLPGRLMGGVVFGW
jgi:uncharacterized membrane protein